MKTDIFSRLLGLLLLAASPAGAGDSWPQFRGPLGDGRTDAAGLPLEWSENRNVRWKTPIPGKGWSSPVVWGEQVWLTTAPVDGKQLFAIALDAASGRIVHNVKVFEIADPQFCHEKNSYASPTPAVEEGRVYVHFGTHGTACLDTGKGTTLWTREDLHCNHHRGPASSPILYKNLLIVNFDGFDVQFVIALDKATGKTVWKKDRGISVKVTDGDQCKAYATPAIFEIGGKPQLVDPGAYAAISYKPETGDEIWRVNCGGMNVASPPLFGNGKLYITTGDGGFKLFAMRPDGTGDVTSTHVDWKFSRAMPSRCGPLLRGDLLFLINESGIASCLDSRTGESVWVQRIGGTYSASPLLAGDRIYLFSEEGNVPVLAASREFKKLAENSLESGFMASPAVGGKSLYLRTLKHIYRIEQAEAPR